MKALLNLAQEVGQAGLQAPDGIHVAEQGRLHYTQLKHVVGRRLRTATQLHALSDRIAACRATEQGAEEQGAEVCYARNEVGRCPRPQSLDRHQCHRERFDGQILKVEQSTTVNVWTLLERQENYNRVE